MTRGGLVSGSEFCFGPATTVKTHRAIRFSRILLLFQDAGKACCHFDKSVHANVGGVSKAKSRAVQEDINKRRGPWNRHREDVQLAGGGGGGRGAFNVENKGAIVMIRKGAVTLSA